MRILFLFLSIGQLSFAQSKYWVVFNDKNLKSLPAISSTTIANRQLQGLGIGDESDLPINNLYIKVIKNKGIEVLQKSRWLNAVSVNLTDCQKNEIAELSFIKKIVPIDRRFYMALSSKQQTLLAPVMLQIEANVFREAGLTAKGITIGVVDAGFYEAPTSQSLKHLFARSAIIDKRDYVNPKHAAHFFTKTESFSDFHGSEVLAAIAGRDGSLQEGLAIDAQFYLARTDHGDKEWRGEEDNWVAAVEWLDSLGIRLINTSLGYAKGFSNPSENYEPSQMDGHTSLISRAADIAVNKKGILLIVSAGNEGDDSTWQIISTPADAEGVIAVGATNQKLWNKIGYSSIGPEFLPYVKPNVSCYSLYGTSLSAPVITGFAACLMQLNPSLTNKQIRTIIEQSAHLYPYPNNYIGYGVPLASRAIELAKNGKMSQIHSKKIKATTNTYQLQIDKKIDLVSVFHKKNAIHVLNQEAVLVRKGQLKLKQQANETHTTVDLKSEVIEVEW
jgi:hypothetical protein